MTKKIKFSIIVPVYNMEQYLSRCIDSILSQDYGLFELICINDGSKDGSLELLRDYARNDSRVIIIDKLNGGLGEARNSGLKIASGDYVWFIDSDDWIKKNSLSILEQCIMQTNYLDAYIIDMEQMDENSFHKVVRSCPRKEGILSSKQYAKDLLLFDALFFAQNKIYKYESIKDFRFNKGFYEDVPQIVLFGEKEFNIYILHEALYFYFSREGSIMKTVDHRVLDIFKQIDSVYYGLYSKKEFQIYCTHLFYYSIAKTYQSINKAGKKDLKAEFAACLRERRNKYGSPLSLLFFKDIKLRRKIKLLNSIRNFTIL